MKKLVKAIAAIAVTAILLCGSALADEIDVNDIFGSAINCKTENVKLVKKAEMKIEEKAEEYVEEYIESSVTVKSSVQAGSLVKLGDEITLTAEIKGFENAALQWQFKDGGEWTDMEGANGLSFTYVIDEINCAYSWRLAVEEN